VWNLDLNTCPALGIWPRAGLRGWWRATTEARCTTPRGPWAFSRWRDARVDHGDPVLYVPSSVAKMNAAGRDGPSYLRRIVAVLLTWPLLAPLPSPPMVTRHRRTLVTVCRAGRQAVSRVVAGDCALVMNNPGERVGDAIYPMGSSGSGSGTVPCRYWSGIQFTWFSFNLGAAPDGGPELANAVAGASARASPLPAGSASPPKRGVERRDKQQTSPLELVRPPPATYGADASINRST